MNQPEHVNPPMLNGRCNCGHWETLHRPDCHAFRGQQRCDCERFSLRKFRP